MKKPELLAPGGSFLSAYYAFEAGADGVYLGLKEFSARKSASNFTLDQLRRIKGLAVDRGRRVYVTVNTVIREGELARLAETLAWLQALSVDGVIVQDLGAAAMARAGFPGLSLHASTQMAIHDSPGLRMAKKLGIRRVILARELPLETIKALREQHPDIELEVFIHGALCYSVSGICLASWALTGRSGNRGECAQICRSLFSLDQGGGGRRAGHFFSCRDLTLGSEVLALARAGIDAFKIEGRMKSPEYVYNAVKLYREVLDRGEELPEDACLELQRRAELSFSRERTTAFFLSPLGHRLIDAKFPGHRGAPLGTIESVKGRSITLTIQHDLSLRDGLGYFPAGPRARAPRAGASLAGEEAAPVDPVIFSVQRIMHAGREAKFARARERVTVEAPPGPPANMPRVGMEVRHLSSRFLDLPQPKEAGFPLYKIPVDFHIDLARGEGACEVKVRFDSASASLSGSLARSVTLEESTRKRDFRQILIDLLKESGESLFTAGHVTLSNGTGMGESDIFVPPSELKKLKNEIYRAADELFHGGLRAAAGRLPQPAARAHQPLPEGLSDTLCHRERLSPDEGPVPYARLSTSPDGSQALVVPAPIAGIMFVPLPPILGSHKPWLEAVGRLAGGRTDARIAVGLNNLSHLALVGDLAALSNVEFFVDFSLYCANSLAVAAIADLVPRLLFAYSWIEGDEGNHQGLAGGPPGALPVVRISPTFRPPLFYSLGCFERHAMRGGACVDGCAKDFRRQLLQGRNRFELVVRDCVTYLFRLPLPP